MANVFLSYSSDDRAIVERIAAALSQAGHEVWWDGRLTGGSAFEKNIEAELEKAHAVVVIWSKSSAQSHWVKDEAVFGRDHGKLIPVCLKGGEQPLGFRQFQAIDFASWRNDAASPSFQSLLASIAEKEGADPPPLREANKSGIRDWVMTHPLAFITGALAASVIAVATLFPIGVNSFLSRTTISGPLDRPAEVSIAVLPFADLSEEGNQEYFSDGLSEELLNVLVRVDGLKVASRTSAFSMKGSKLAIGEIAEKLKVNHIVEGSVRKSNSRIRITAQLIDARDDRHLWSETYDRHMSDIFRIQDEIATSIVNALRDELGMAAEKEITIKPATENLNAYDVYLKARELYTARGRGNVGESLKLFESAVEMDRNFARGWEGLAAVYAIATSWGYTDRDYSALSLDAARKALELDPDLSMPYAVMGLTYRTHYPTPWEESLFNLEKALERDPKNTSAWLWSGMNYMAIGDHDRALHAFENCLTIDEAFRLCRKYRSVVHLFKGEPEPALVDAESNAEAGYFGDFDVYIPALLERGDRLTAFTISRTLNWWQDFPHSDYIAALANPDDMAPDAFENIEKWAAEKNVDILDATQIVLAFRAYDRINVENFDNDYEDIWLPAFAHFRKTDEFRKLVSDLGLTAYWRKHGFPAQCKELVDGEFECA